MTALVLELVEGPTLADRLARGPLPIADALAIARQLAEALDAAHEKGIVHRDLKPANIVLQGAALASGVPSSDQRARVLDFGLARTIAGGLDGDLTERPPGSFDGTAEGRILGTPAYMSPEQARGHAVDRRTDIWAFGCVLFEMLAGRRAFAGDTVSDTFVSILEREPEWTALPAATPASIRTLLERCLRKDPRKRLHDIADARIELEDVNELVGSTRSAVAVAPAGPARGRERLAWIAAGVLALALGGTMLVNRREVPPTGAELVEFPILPPEGWRFIMARLRRVSRRAAHRVRGCLEKRLVAVGPIVRCGRSPADCWHRRRAQSILEPRQPVDWLLCQQSAENGAGRR